MGTPATQKTSVQSEGTFQPCGGLLCDVAESPLTAVFEQKPDNHLWEIPVLGGDWVQASRALPTVRFYESL